MCEQCLAECEVLGEVVPGLALVQARKAGGHMQVGDFGLVRVNDPDVVWTVAPVPDPWEGLSDEEIEARPHEEFSGWSEKVEAFSKACQTQVHLSDALRIGVLCQAAGYDIETDGSLEHWLFHRMGVLLDKGT